MSSIRPVSFLTYCIACLCLLRGVEAGAQISDGSTGAKDTVYVVHRDTIVEVHRDTVFVVREDTAGSPGSGAWASGRESNRERVLRRREEREEAFLRLDPVRTSKHAFAHFIYPSSVFRTTFPQVKYGLTYVNKGRWGLSAQLGLHLDPSWLIGDQWQPERFGEARYGLRGASLGLEARYYFDDLREHEPFYFGLGVSGSVAPVVYGAYAYNPEIGYARFDEVTAKGKEYTSSFVLGWDGRFRKNFAAEVAFGVEVGQRGLFTDDPRDNRSLQGGNGDWGGWSNVGSWRPNATPFLRIGVGLGHW